MDIVRYGAYHKCAVCGKRFFIRFPDDWIYRRNKQLAKTRLYMCSWHCLREYDATHTDLRKVKKSEKTREEWKEWAKG